MNSFDRSPRGTPRALLPVSREAANDPFSADTHEPRLFRSFCLITRHLSAVFLLCAGLFASPASTRPAAGSAALDIAPFAKRCCVDDKHTSQLEFDYDVARQAGANAQEAADGRYIYGLQWTEERDISEVRFHRTREAAKFEVQYWFRNWPYPPPQMPSMEDPVDDPWQGKWLAAAVKSDCAGNDCRITFLPLAASENPNTRNLPGVTYRRAVKMRLVFTTDPSLEHVQVFSGSTVKTLEMRVELGAGETAPHIWEGTLDVYNGWLRKLSLWKGATGDSVGSQHFRVSTAGSPKGVLLTLDVTEPTLPGSQDVTDVTLSAADRTFSFAVPDVEKGPVYVPAFHAYVSLASDAHSFSPSIVQKGKRIRERLAREPEQTYERASKEIPALDPTHREGGGRLYVPLAADASWQKFAFEWGGNIFVDKLGTKAKGKELKRLEWAGGGMGRRAHSGRLDWRLGTGATPNFRPGWHDSTLTVLDDYLPVAMATWTAGGIHYTEEGFATLLSGPLSPDDPARNEETPSVLMAKLTARNPGSAATHAHLWLAMAPDEAVSYENSELVAGNGRLVRARLWLPDSAHATAAQVADGGSSHHGVHIELPLAGGEEQRLFLELPFIPRLTEAEHQRLKELDYETERARVVQYWQGVTAHVAPFRVPERRFNTFARAALVHIRISATKDPKSHLYMVPAASYIYPVFANEAAFQCMMLDALGDHALAAQYLDTFVRLQGSRPFDGTFTGNQSAVYHGARVDDEYDYTAAQYNLDHGTVLWALAEHYWYTRDKDWLSHQMPSMKRAADWIVEQRQLTKVEEGAQKVPEYGLLPAGHLEDNDDWGHWFAVNAYAAAGMTRFAQALADTGAPEATHYLEEASAYTADLRRAVLGASQRSPVVRLRDNTYVPFIPPLPYQRFRLFGPLRVAYYTRYPQKVKPLFRLASDREVLYGPLILLATDVFHANEPFADWVLDDWEDNVTLSSSLGLNVHGWVDDEYWFSQGGMVFQANLQNPVLVYLRRNEVPAAIRNLYNDFVACYYPTVNAFTEEYHQWVQGSGPFFKIPDEARFVHRVRDTLVREEGDALWLLAGIPRPWLAPGEKIELHNAPTDFGPASLELGARDSRVSGSIALPTRNTLKSAWLVVRAPEGKPIRAVEIDGQPWRDFDAASERIRLPLKAVPMQISIQF